jgi:hypothetical protein
MIMDANSQSVIATNVKSSGCFIKPLYRRESLRVLADVDLT